MATQILYQTWDGGEGWNCPTELIGYCKEEPFEVLKSIIMTHNIYHYLDLYRPIDYAFPNNVTGLIINEFKDYYNGMTITGNLNELDLSKAKTNRNRSKSQILNDLELCRKWHCKDPKFSEKHEPIINKICEYVESNL